MIHTFTIDFLGRPHTMNDERQAHHFTSAKIRREWKEATIKMCVVTRAPRGLERIGVLIQPIYTKGNLPDPDASAPTAKAILDGLVTGKTKGQPGYGVVPDDCGKHVAYVCLMAPIKDPSCNPGVRVTIIERTNDAEELPALGCQARLPEPQGTVS